jgi:TctA family transporter
MDETIKELYRHREKAFERQIRLVEIRLQFVSWLFGIASAALFSSLAIIRTSETSDLCFILTPESAALMAAIIALVSLFFTYKAKTEGNKSIEGVLEQLTYLDVQAAVTLDENLPTFLSQYDFVTAFLKDDLLFDPYSKNRMTELDQLPDRVQTELYWQQWLFKAVTTSLFFLFISVCLYMIQ